MKYNNNFIYYNDEWNSTLQNEVQDRTIID